MRPIRLLCLLTLLSAPRLWADTVYTYTGNTFTDVSGVFTTNDRVSGYFETATPLAPDTTYYSLTYTAFEFSNGYQTFNSLNPDLGFLLETDAAGGISQWLIFASDPSDFENSVTTYSLIQTDKFGPYLAANDFGNHDPQPDPNGQYESSAQNYQDPGTWTVTTTPEPSSLLLLSTGALTALGAVARRLKRA